MNASRVGLRELLLALAGYVAKAARGSRPMVWPSWRRFLVYIARGVRIHCYPIPAGAALAGAAAAPEATISWPVFLAAGAAGLGWGGGQLLSDLLDTVADSVDAPHRPAVQGLLPIGPTLAVASTIGLAVFFCVLIIHPDGLWLAATAAALLFAYGSLRKLPVLGNLAHALLIANATWIGAAASQPDYSLWACVSGTWDVALVCGAWAGLYLEANYEKDRRGDAAAGYTSLPHLVGIRLSAAIRALGALVVAAVAYNSLDAPLGRGAFTIATLLLLISTVPPLVSNSEQAALRGYRFAVHAANLGLLALGLPVLPLASGLILLLVSIALTESAFRRSPNP